MALTYLEATLTLIILFVGFVFAFYMFLNLKNQLSLDSIYLYYSMNNAYLCTAISTLYYDSIFKCQQSNYLITTSKFAMGKIYVEFGGKSAVISTYNKTIFVGEASSSYLIKKTGNSYVVI